MSKRSQQILAFILIGLGGLYLIANFVNIDPSDIFWPLVLILIGALFIFRPKYVAPDNARVFFAGDKDFGSDWDVQDEDLRMFAGDISIDLDRAKLPAGKTTFSVRCFASDIDIHIPEDVGLKISSTGFVVETKFDGESKSNVMTGFDYQSDNFASAEKKLHLITQSFAVELNIHTL